MGSFEKNLNSTKDANATLIANLSKKEEKKEEIGLNNQVIDKNSTILDIYKDIVDNYSYKSNKKTMEETHKRVTFMLDREVNKKLDDICKDKRGLKTILLNKAVKYIVDGFE